MINFGQTDTVKIKPPFRYIDKDTFTVFTIQDERAIAYKIKQGEDCQDNIETAERTIIAADSLIASQRKENSILTLQKETLNEQVSTKDEIISTYKEEVTSCKKQIKILKIEKKILAGVTAALTILSTYLILK